MWGSVLVLALVTVPDPPRLVAMYLVTSRPNPGKNLLFYYIGCLVLNFWFLLVPLAVLHFVPTFGSFVQRYAPPPAADGSATVQPIPLALGVLSLLIAARLAMRLRARRKAPNASAAENDTTLGDSEGDAAPEPKPNAIAVTMSRVLTVEEGSTGFGAAVRRLAGRVYGAWKEGSVWISLFMGLTYSPLQATAVLAILATSGAPIVSQLTAASAFVAIMLTLVELILVGYFLAPAKTEAVLRSAHGWTQTHNLELLAAISAVGGVFLLATGLGVF